MAEAEKGGRTAEANSSPGRYFARLSPTHPRVQKGGREAQRSVRLPAASLTASGQPANATATHCQTETTPRPTTPEGDGGWLDSTSLHGRRGSAESKKRTSCFFSASLLRAACRHSTHTHTQASSSGGNSSMPALPLAWNLANRSPNVDHQSPSSSHAFSHTLPHTHTLTRARRGPRAQSPFPGCRLSLTVVPYCIASSPGVQPCSAGRPAQGRAISPLETFPFLLGASSSAANGPVPGHQMQTAGLEQTKLKQTRPSIRWTDWSPPALLFDPLSGFDTSPLIWLFFDYWL